MLGTDLHKVLKGFDVFLFFSGSLREMPMARTITKER